MVCDIAEYACDCRCRLCELNVARQVFSVSTSPAVQSAWARGQAVSVHGLIYDVATGLIRRLVGPIHTPVSQLALSLYNLFYGYAAHPVWLG
jgi:carbonic anhydrase